MAVLSSLHSIVRRDRGAIRRNPATVLRLQHRFATWLRLWSVMITLSACGAGCALFNTGGWRSAGLGGDDQETLLKPLQAAPNALRLEYQIIERPADDPLLGGILWDELVEIGLFDHEIRRALNENGIRVGVCGNPPPAALEKLRGHLAEIEDPSVPAGARRRSGQILVLPDGGHVDAQTGGMTAECTIKIRGDGEETTERSFKKARGVIVVSAQSTQEGWATVRFLPEIRYGDVLTRPVANASGWERVETGQSVHKLMKQKFEMTLVEGDSVIISSMGEPNDRVGDVFFRTVVDGVPVQRLLVVRLLRTDIKPERVE